jgi:polysaccharide export outer membrane protein
MKHSSIVLFLEIFAACGCIHAQNPAQNPTQIPAPQPPAPSAIQAPAIQAPAVSSPVAPVPSVSTPAPADATAPPAPQNFGVQATPPAPPAGASADVEPDYVLGPEDVINVNVWKQPELSGSLGIRPDGKVSLPLLGDVTAAGVMPMALAASISDQLKKFVNDPTVTVTVTAVNSKRIFFIGLVGHPGPVAMTRQFSMLQAISAAGGLETFADQKHIYILRTVNGKEQKIFFNYKKALKSGDEQGIKLVPGDTIVVP